MKLLHNRYVLSTAIAGGAILLCVLYILLVPRHQSAQPLTVKINNDVVYIERAQTSEEKSRGLCCRDNLASTSGMLFVYDKPGDYRFWMKDTLIPLDIIWIDSSKKIIHIEPSVQPSSYPKTFGADSPAQYVLEVNAGYAKKHSIKIGDLVNF